MALGTPDNSASTNGQALGHFVPRPVDGCFVSDRGVHEPGKRFALSSGDGAHIVYLNDDEMRLWELIDGKRSVDEICQAHLDSKQTLVLPQVYSLIQRLAANQFFVTSPKFVYFDENTEISHPPLTHLFPVTLPGAEALGKTVAALLSAAGLFRVRAIAIWLFLILVGAGFWLFDDFAEQRFFRPLTLDGEAIWGLPSGYLGGVALLLAIHFICSFVHAMAMLTVEGHCAGRWSPLRMVFNYGLPCFNFLPRWRHTVVWRRRMACSAAGVGAELVGATLAGGAASLITAPLVADLCYKFMIVFLLRVFVHLSPLAIGDFNAIMAEWSQIPRFRRRFSRFLLNRFATTIRQETPTRVQLFFLGYALIAIIWVNLSMAIATALMGHEIYMLADLFNTTGGENLTLWLLLLGVIGLPIATAFLAAIGAMVFFLNAIIKHRSFFKTRSAALWGRAVVIIVIGLSMMALPSSLALTLLFGLVVALLLAGTGIAYLGAQADEGSLGFARICAGIAILLGAKAVATHVIDLEHATRLLQAVATILFLISHITLFRLRLYSGLFRRSALSTELRLFACSSCVFMVTGSVAALSTPSSAPTWSVQLAWIGLAIAALAVARLGQATGHKQAVPVSLVLQNPEQNPDALNLILEQVRRVVGQLLSQEFGPAYIAAIERRIQSCSGLDSFTFSGDFSLSGTFDECRQGMFDVLRKVDNSLTRNFGPAYSKMVMDNIAESFNYEAFLFLHKHVLTSTRFCNPHLKAREFGPATCLEHISHVSVFTGLPTESLRRLTEHLTIQHFDANAIIVAEGDLGNSAYVILAGETQVETKDAFDEAKVLAFLRPGGFFGEAALVKDARRNATVRAVIPTTVLCWHRHDLDAVATADAELVASVRSQLQTLHVLFNIRLFADLPASMLQTIASKIRYRQFEDGEAIVQKGEVGRHFFLIEDGAVDILDVTDDGREWKVRMLGKHEYFGEIALIQESVRTMTVRSSGGTKVLCLDKTAMLQLMGSNTQFATNLEVIGEQRLIAS